MKKYFFLFLVILSLLFVKTSLAAPYDCDQEGQPCDIGCCAGLTCVAGYCRVPTPTPQIFLNSKTNTSCKNVCESHNISCLSAGLNAPNYNDNLFWTVDMGECGTQRSDSLCTSVSMTDDQEQCDGQNSRWTYCKCGGPTLTPTPTSKPKPTLTPTPTLPANTYLNSNSNESCDRICSGHNQVCDSIGLYSQADSGKYYDYYSIRGCRKLTGNCSTKMNTQFQTCEGNKSQWTFCKCKTAPASPPTIISPVNGATLPSASFEWTKCSNAEAYYIWANGPGVEEKSQVIPKNEKVPFIWNPGFQRGKEYTWQLCTCDNANCSGEISCGNKKKLTFWYLAHPVPTNTPTVPPPSDCLCQAGDVCHQSCIFDKFPNVTPPYANPIKCSREVSIGGPTPIQSEKNVYCQRNLRTKGDADGANGTNEDDYFYYLTVVTGGSIPATVNPDFNGDGYVTVSDLNIWKISQKK